MSPIDTAPTTSPVRIAIVTSDEDVADRIGTAVEPLGKVEIVLGARHALGRIHDGDFDVAIVDMDVTQASGLVHCVQGLGRAFPVIALTDDIDDDTDLGVTVLHRNLTVGAMLRVAVARSVLAAEAAYQPIAV
jgi:CheY-like chemotaxis protein